MNLKHFIAILSKLTFELHNNIYEIYTTLSYANMYKYLIANSFVFMILNLSSHLKI